MKHKVILFSCMMASNIAIAENLLLDGQFDELAPGLKQFNSQSYPWELVDYLDEQTAIAGQIELSDSQFSDAQTRGNVLFLRNGAVRQRLLTHLMADQQFNLTLQLGRKLQGDFPAYRIGLQTGQTFAELANERSHGVPVKGEFRTLSLNFSPDSLPVEFSTGNQDIFLVIEAVSDKGNGQLYADNVLLTMGAQYDTSLEIDSDADGMPDDWELTYGLNTADPEDARLDSDGDGISNVAEYQSGTDPFDLTDNLQPYQLQQLESPVKSSSETALLTRLPIEILGIRLVPQSQQPIACDSNGEGALYYDTITQLTLVCNGIEWTPVEGEDLVDDADASVSNELVESISFDDVNHVLTLVEAGQTYSVDLQTLSQDSDDQNEIQTLSKTGNTVSLSRDGGSFTDEVNDADADPLNEIQIATRIDADVTLSQGGGSFSINDADADSNNELITSATFAPQTGTLTIVDAGNTYVLDLTSLGNDADADASNEIQTLSKTGNLVSLSLGGGSFTDEVDDADADASNELQTLSRTGNQISLSQGGGSFTDEVDDADADASNELQTLSRIGNQISLSQSGGSFTDEVDDADADASNELQTLSKVGNLISLSQNGGSFTDEVDDADADASNELQTLSRSGNQISLSQSGGSFTDEVDDADADASNELQTLSRSGNQISLSQGGGSFTDNVDDADADASNEIQVITKVGNTVTLSRSGGSFTDAVNDADADATNEIQTLSASGATVSLSNGGGSVTLNVADGDSNSSNELQTISKSGNTVTLSNSGGSFTDAVNDADASTSNELIDSVSFNSSNRQLSINENGNNQSVTLSGLATEAYVDSAVASAKTGVLYVYDGTGTNRIARFLQFRTDNSYAELSIWWVLSSSGFPAPLEDLRPAGTRITDLESFYFTGANCTGTPLVINYNSHQYNPFYNSGRFYQGQSGTNTNRSYASVLNRAGTCSNSSSSRNLAIAQTVTNALCGDFVCKLIEE